MPWEQLAEIWRRNADDIRTERSEIPSACPNDGEPLKEGPDGVLFCPSDGWQYPRDYIRP